MYGKEDIMKKYVEIERTNITPKQFWSYCKREIKRRADMNLEDWCESYEEWSTPTQETNHRWQHKDWDVPTTEICKTMPYNWQLFLRYQYNFIMEFDFLDFRTGCGYLYLSESRRQI